MKWRHLFYATLVALLYLGLRQYRNGEFKSEQLSSLPEELVSSFFVDGDIVFSKLNISKDSSSIKSPQTKVGMLFKSGKELYVLEAERDVQLIPFVSWLSKNGNPSFILKRLKNNELLTPKNRGRLKEVAQNFRGKKLDDQLNPAMMICEIYREALGVNITELDSSNAKTALEFVINSPLLETVTTEHAAKN